MSRTAGQMHKITDFGTLKMSSFSSDQWHDCMAIMLVLDHDQKHQSMI